MNASVFRTMPCFARRRGNRRIASILVAVLVCMGVMTAIMGTAVTSSLRARRQMRHEIQMEQTQWLLSSGLRYAQEQHRSREDYSGETLVVQPPFDGSAMGTLEIRIEDDGSVRTLHVTAMIRRDESASSPTKRSHQIQLQDG